MGESTYNHQDYGNLRFLYPDWPSISSFAVPWLSIEFFFCYPRIVYWILLLLSPYCLLNLFFFCPLIVCWIFLLLYSDCLLNRPFTVSWLSIEYWFILFLSPVCLVNFTFTVSWLSVELFCFWPLIDWWIVLWRSSDCLLNCPFTVPDRLLISLFRGSSYRRIPSLIGSLAFFYCVFFRICLIFFSRLQHSLSHILFIFFSCRCLLILSLSFFPPSYILFRYFCSADPAYNSALHFLIRFLPSFHIHHTLPPYDITFHYALPSNIYTTHFPVRNYHPLPNSSAP